MPSDLFETITRLVHAPLSWVVRLYFHLFDRLLCYPLLRLSSEYIGTVFLNLGYVFKEGEECPLLFELEGTPAEKAHAGLYERTLSGSPAYPAMEGKSLLDVGCGQGGGIEWITRSRPKAGQTTGLDSVAPDRKSIIEGDAHALPFSACSFDIVMNVESSHLYSDSTLFFTEAFRVLTPGGFLLWSDLRWNGQEEGVKREAARAGFILQTFVDITENVLLGAEITSEHYDRMLNQSPWWIRMFSSTLREIYCAPGTRSYERFAKREKRYWVASWQKPFESTQQMLCCFPDITN